jgi:hypothetical protein
MAQQIKVARGNTPKPEINQLYWNRHSSSKNKETSPVAQQKAKNGVSGLPTQNAQKKQVLNIQGSKNKPDYLRDIRSTPLPCQPEIKYKKL